MSTLSSSIYGFLKFSTDKNNLTFIANMSLIEYQGDGLVVMEEQCFNLISISQAIHQYSYECTI